MPKSQEKRCFFITPIGEGGSIERTRSDWMFHYIEEVCVPLGYIVHRADRMPGSPMITARIFEAVTEADICIADLTGLNANVFYELGIRHSVAKPAIHLAELGTRLPFDNAQHDTIFYSIAEKPSVDTMKAELLSAVESVTAVGYVVSNPLTAALGVAQARASADPQERLMGDLSERLQRLETVVARTASAINVRDLSPNLSALDDLAYLSALHADLLRPSGTFDFQERRLMRALQGLDATTAGVWIDNLMQAAMSSSAIPLGQNVASSLRLEKELRRVTEKVQYTTLKS